MVDVIVQIYMIGFKNKDFGSFGVLDWGHVELIAWKTLSLQKDSCKMKQIKNIIQRF